MKSLLVLGIIDLLSVIWPVSRPTRIFRSYLGRLKAKRVN